ncbi:MAG: hypothetical protein RLZZ127_981 [Planctomycetota bacterium]|jgi:hypothetical protein
MLRGMTILIRIKHTRPWAIACCLSAISVLTGLDLDRIPVRSWTSATAQPWIETPAVSVESWRKLITEGWQATAPSDMRTHPELLDVMDVLALTYASASFPAMSPAQAMSTLERRYPLGAPAPLMVSFARMEWAGDEFSRMMHFSDAANSTEWQTGAYRGPRFLSGVLLSRMYLRMFLDNVTPAPPPMRHQALGMMATTWADAFQRGELAGWPRAYLLRVGGMRFASHDDVERFRSALIPALTRKAAPDPWFMAMMNGLLARIAHDMAGAGPDGKAAKVLAKKELTEARRWFTAAADMRPDDPWAPSELAILALAEDDGEDPLPWIARTMRAAFDYSALHQAVLSYGMPRAGGSHAAMLRYGVACADTKRFDSALPRVLLRAIQMVATDTQPVGRDAPDLRRPALRQAAERVIDGYVAARPGDASLRTELASHRIAIRLVCGDTQGAQTLVKQFPGGQPSEDVAAAYGVSFQALMKAGGPKRPAPGGAAGPGKPASPGF